MENHTIIARVDFSHTYPSINFQWPLQLLLLRQTVNRLPVVKSFFHKDIFYRKLIKRLNYRKRPNFTLQH